MNKYHEELLKKLISKNKRTGSHLNNDSYLGSRHFYYDISVPDRRSVAKEWVNSNKDISLSELFGVLDSLIQGKSHEEKTIAGMLIEYLPNQRKEIFPQKLDTWLDELQGWAEIDSLCQSKFSADDILKNWNAWKEAISKFNQDANITKRRASLVLLTGPVGNSDDKRLSDLSFKVIEQLEAETDILITKAVSWLLRTLIKYHREEVKLYITKHKSTLPKIALRETNNKLKTGKK